MRISSVLLVSTLLAACNGAQPVTEAAPPDAVVAPAARPGKPGLVIRVMREGGGGIDATINQIDARGQVSFYATVSGSGEMALENACEAGERFQAEPTVPAYLRGPSQECAERIEFMLYSTLATLQFIKRGDAAAGGGDLLAAQTNYGTAADRLQYAEPDKARQLRVLSTVAAGRALGVTQPVTGPTGSEQPTPELTDRVREFQQENGIEATGRLDARTRDSIGRMQLRGGAVIVRHAASGGLSPTAAPALVVTPQSVTPAVEVRLTVAELLAAPASSQTAAVIDANKLKARGGRDAASK